MSINTIKMTDLKAVIRRQAFAHPSKKRSILLLGPPGSGKSEFIKGISECTGIFMGSTTDEDKAKGVFARNNKDELELMMTPAMQQFINDAIAYPRTAILFIDELGEMDKACALAMNHLILDRMYCDVKLPDNVLVICASNARHHKAGAGQFMTHQLDRLKVYELEQDTEGWLDWATEIVDYELPLRKRDAEGKIIPGKFCLGQFETVKMPRITETVTAYIYMKPQALYSHVDSPSDASASEMTNRAVKDGKKIVTPRSVTALSDEERLADWLGEPMTLSDYASHIVEERAGEYHALKGMEMPTHADLLEGRAELPEAALAKWVTVIRCGQLLTPGNAEKTARLMKNLNPELVEVGLKICGKTAHQYLKSKGVSVANGYMALVQTVENGGAYYFPGFSKELLAPGIGHGLRS